MSTALFQTEGLEMLESYGVPEHFITDVGKIESAGGGNIRVFHYTRRDRLLVPVYTAVMHAESLIFNAEAVKRAALEIFRRENAGLITQ